MILIKFRISTDILNLNLMKDIYIAVINGKENENNDIQYIIFPLQDWWG